MAAGGILTVPPVMPLKMQDNSNIFLVICRQELT